MTQTADIDTYWNCSIILGEEAVRQYSGTSLIRLKVHHSVEKIFHRRENLFPIPLQKGTRSYFHAKPYILIPRITLSFALGSRPQTDTGAIGKVVSSEVMDLQEVEIGQAQAWYCPQDHSLVLWECFLEAPFRNQDLLTDKHHKLVWQGFEQQLLKEVPDVQRIYMTFEPASLCTLVFANHVMDKRRRILTVT